MSDVRRVNIIEESEGELGGEEVDGPLCADNEDGTHALVPWEMWEKLRDKIERLKKSLEFEKHCNTKTYLFISEKGGLETGVLVPKEQIEAVVQAFWNGFQADDLTNEQCDEVEDAFYSALGIEKCHGRTWKLKPESEHQP